MRLKQILILFFAFHASFSFAQTRKYSNEFLAIGVGAQSLGRSNAVVATTNDVSSGYWNPSGLLSVQSDFQVALMHSEYFAGIAKYDYGAFAKRIDSTSAMGGSFIRFGVDNIPNTTQLIDANGQIDYDRVTSFTAADYAFLFSYAKVSPIKGLNLGGNAKVVRRKVGDFANSWGFGLDAGAQYVYKGWQFGLMARDITTTFNAWRFNLDDKTKAVFQQTGNEIPTKSIELTLPKFILGAAKKYNFKKFSALGEINLDFTTDGQRNVLIHSKAINIDPHLGVELGYAGIVFLRGGIGNFQTIKEENNLTRMTLQPNMGIGVKIKAVTIDYALTNIGQQVGLLSNVFSLKLNLNRSKTSQPIKI